MFSNGHVRIREGNRRGVTLEASHSSDGPGSVSLFLEAPCQEGMGVAGRCWLAVCPRKSLLCCVIMWMANNDRLHLCPQVQRAAPGSRTTTHSVERKWHSLAFGHRTRLLPYGSVWRDGWSPQPNHREVGAPKTEPSSSFSYPSTVEFSQAVS